MRSSAETLKRLKAIVTLRELQERRAMSERLRSREALQTAEREAEYAKSRVEESVSEWGHTLARPNIHIEVANIEAEKLLQRDALAKAAEARTQTAAEHLEAAELELRRSQAALKATHEWAAIRRRSVVRERQAKSEIEAEDMFRGRASLPLARSTETSR